MKARQLHCVLLLAAPVNMAGPSPSALNAIQEQLNKLNRLAIEELCKGADHNEVLVAALQKARELLVAQVDMQTSCEFQYYEVCAVL